MSEHEDAGRDRRWPRAVYGVGGEPDPRFTLANERTFLAWIRTSLALLAAAVVFGVLTVPLPGWLHSTLTLIPALAAGAGAGAAWFRWARTERALRRSRPLPGATALAALGTVVVVLVAAVLVGVLAP